MWNNYYMKPIKDFRKNKLFCSTMRDCCLALYHEDFDDFRNLNIKTSNIPLGIINEIEQND